MVVGMIMKGDGLGHDQGHQGYPGNINDDRDDQLTRPTLNLR